jgi:hypothetical protein
LLAPVWVLDRPGGHHPACASTAVFLHARGI